jgi:predicted DNA-binding WGR domain protein
MTKRQKELVSMVEKKWVLLSESDGARGDNGKKKVYEIVVKDNMLFTSWGMAEKSTRASSTKFFGSNNAAMSEALEKLSAKTAKGYVIAYTA